MKTQLYKQNDSPRKHAEAIVKDYAFLNGLGESTLPLVNRLGEGTVPIDYAHPGRALGRPAVETIMGDFG